MTLPDINLLIHAHNAESSVHEKARHWWDGKLSGPEGVGLAWVVVLGFIRITTHRAILNNPLPVNEVMDRIESWFSMPHIHMVTPSERHFGLLKDYLNGLGAAGNLTTDAHLASLAVERGYELQTTDTDFARFPGLKWRNPLL